VKPSSVAWSASIGAELAVGQRAIAVLGDAPPRAEVDLVDAHRRVAVVVGAARHPAGVLPGVVVGPHDRRGRRRVLGPGRQRIGLVDAAPAGADDVELVAGAVADAGDHALPDAGGVARRQRVGAGVPVVPVADDRHRARAGRPHREVGPGRRRPAVAVGAELAGGDHVGAQLVMQPDVGALVEQVQVVGRQQREGHWTNGSLARAAAAGNRRDPAMDVG
jgi:hypothetical protein